MLHRNIKDRVETIAPILKLDRDPYMVISEGRLYWIQDATLDQLPSTMVRRLASAWR